MEAYDRILRRDEDGKGCMSCYWGTDDECQGIGGPSVACLCGDDMAHYASYDQVKGWLYEAEKRAGQLEGLIEEAEAGSQKWVRDNTLFLCSSIQECDFVNQCVKHKEPHKYGMGCRHICESIKTKPGVCTPYRGTKGEEQIWPGINGETHLEALREIAAKENGTYVEPSEVEKDMICASRLTGSDDGCIDCNGGVRHKAWEGCECYTPVEYRGDLDAEEIIGNHIMEEAKANPTTMESSEVIDCPGWGEDGYGCMTCKSVSIEMGCRHAQYEACGIELEYCMYERKEDRSDHEYNDKKAELKAAGESVLKEDDVEYVVIKNFLSVHELSMSKMSPETIKCMCGSIALMGLTNSEGDSISKGSLWWIYRHELLRLGFIEEKVCDPGVKLGDTFSHKEGVCMLVNSSPGNMHFVTVKAFHAHNIGAGISCYINEITNEVPFENSKLSDCVGKSHIKEFKPVEVTVTEVE